MGYIARRFPDTLTVHQRPSVLASDLTPGTTLTPEALTHAARAAWEVSGLTQAAAAEQFGVNRVTFAHAIGTPARSLQDLRRRIVEAYTPGVRIAGPVYVVEATDPSAEPSED